MATNGWPVLVHLLWLLPAAAAGLHGLHRLALWAESRGWIYYLRKHGGEGAMAGILQDLQTHLQPRIEHVRKARADATGGPWKDGESGSRP
jgi:hypothetical protein